VPSQALHARLLNAGLPRTPEIYVEVRRAGERYHLVLLNARGMYEYNNSLDNHARRNDFRDVQAKLDIDDDILYVRNRGSCWYLVLFVLLAVALFALWVADSVVAPWVRQGRRRWAESLKNIVVVLAYEAALATLFTMLVPSIS